MRKFTTTIAMMIAMVLSLFAQIPQTMSYQAVVRNAENAIVASQSVSIELSILQGSDEGTAVYTETHNATTNANGLITLEMGAGESSDNFSAIDWSAGPYFVKTVAEIDGKQVSGVSPMLVVPYAKYAETAGNVPDMSEYAKKSDIPADVDLSNYATKSELPSLDGYAKTEDIPSLDGYAKTEDLPNMSEYTKTADLPTVDLSGYYSKAEIDALLAALEIKIGEGGNFGSDKTGDVTIENGAIQAPFSISADKQVYFSMGNLQYKASTGEWRFAEHQYDMIGNDNASISSSYSGYIDLFGWGTSGNNGKNPYMTSTSYSDYGVVGDENADIAGTNYDWGVYNAISNGGGTAGMWRTLTNSEWNYVLNTRTDASALKGSATVNGVKGMILLPDNWTTPEGITFTSGMNGFKSNTYSTSDWAKMEANGAVFLPAAGYRYGSDVSGVGSYGYYWSSSAFTYNDAYSLYFDSGSAGMGSSDRGDGLSVRLVRGL